MNFFERLFQDPKKTECQEESQSPSVQASSHLIDEKSPSPLAIIYRSELDYISRCVLDSPNIETGGQLFGFWTSQGAPVVLYAIGPGRNANHQKSFFNQDIEYLDAVGNKLLDSYTLQHIGEWHSHHQLGLARPSGHDAQTMFNGLRTIPQRRLLLCICNYDRGHSTINPYTFHENDLRNYADAMWLVKELESPFRPLVDAALSHLLVHPHTQQASHGTLRIVGKKKSTVLPENKTVQFSGKYWLVRPGNIDTMKQMMALVNSRWPEKEIKIQANPEGIAQIDINNGEFDVIFPQNFPNEAPLLFMEGRSDVDIPWNAPIGDNNIFEAFQEWLVAIDPLLKAPESPDSNISEL